MGADGHIDVFNWEKIVAHFGEEKAKVLLTAANSYLDEMKTPDGKAFTVYHGYYTYGVYSADYNDDNSREWEEIYAWAMNNAKLFTWEVWT